MAFDTFTLSGDSNTISADGIKIHLDYCIPKNWSKKRTDVTGVQSDQPLHPDTGPAGGFVEIQLTVDRSVTSSEALLKSLIHWYGTQNTNSTLKRGFLSLTNTDNPPLDVTASSTAGYRLIQFEQLDPIDYKARQVFRILIQFSGDTTKLGV